MAYVYRHIRLDKNIPFYIGIGSDSDGEYKRANNKGHTRNKHWHNIVGIAGYEIEIIIDNISWEEAIRKEIEFIALYGRKQHGGILCNLTDGGEGGFGMITSEETKKKQSLKRMGKAPANKGKPMLPHVQEAIFKAITGKPNWSKGIPKKPESVEKQRQKIKEWYLHNDHPLKGSKMPLHVKQKLIESRTGATPWNKGKPMLPHVREALMNSIKGKPSWNKGIPTTEVAKEKLRIANKGKTAWNAGRKMTEEYKLAHPQNKLCTEILKCDLDGNIIEEFVSTKDAAEKTGYSIECIRMAARNQYSKKYTNIYRGFIWKQKSPEINRALKRNKNS